RPGPVQAGARGGSFLPCGAQGRSPKNKVEGINMTHEVREKIRILAGEALSWFERRERHDGNVYWTLEEGAPEWVRKLAFAAHKEGKILPEDFRHLFIVEALEALAENPEEPESMLEPDVYTSQLL